MFWLVYLMIRFKLFLSVLSTYLLKKYIHCNVRYIYMKYQKLYRDLLTFSANKSVFDGQSQVCLVMSELSLSLDQFSSRGAPRWDGRSGSQHEGTSAGIIWEIISQSDSRRRKYFVKSDSPKSYLHFLFKSNKVEVIAMCGQGTLRIHYVLFLHRYQN